MSGAQRERGEMGRKMIFLLMQRESQLTLYFDSPSRVVQLKSCSDK